MLAFFNLLMGIAILAIPALIVWYFIMRKNRGSFSSGSPF